MRLDDGACRERLGAPGTRARHDPPRPGADLVPVVYVVEGERISIPIDTVKPKSGRRLQRLVNLAADARCVPPRRPLRDDWSQLWWVRAHGEARGRAHGRRRWPRSARHPCLPTAGASQRAAHHLGRVTPADRPGPRRPDPHADRRCQGLARSLRRVPEYADVPTGILEEVRSVCLALPESYEEEAWVGTRWRIRTRTFAHVLTVEGGADSAHARAVGTDGPTTVVTFRSAGEELEMLRAAGHPFFYAGWGRERGGHGARRGHGLGGGGRAAHGELLRARSQEAGGAGRSTC